MQVNSFSYKRINALLFELLHSTKIYLIFTQVCMECGHIKTTHIVCEMLKIHVFKKLKTKLFFIQLYK